MRFLFSMLLLIAECAWAEFREGTHYKQLHSGAADIGAGIEEYFSFSCGGCNAMERWLIEHDHFADVGSFNRIHVGFGGPGANWSQHAYAILVRMQAEHLIPKIFARIHRDRRPFRSIDDVVEFFVAEGFDAEEVEKMATAFSVKMDLQKMNARTQEFQIQRIPAFVVLGKYQVNVRKLDSSDSLGRLIEYLVGLEQASS